MMKSLFILTILALIFNCRPVTAQDVKDGEMKTYYLGLLYKGPKRDHPKEEAEKIQAAHLAYIGKMAEAGQLNLAGPMMDDGELRGIFVFNVKSKEEALELCNNDPAVKAGRLRVELHPWYSQKGASLK